MNFYDNFLRLCNKVGKSPSKVLLEMGGTKSAVTRWKNGGMPTDATIQKIADYFGVQVSDLMGDVLWTLAKDGGLEHAKAALEQAAISETEEKVLGKNAKKTPAPEGERSVSDDDIKFALFGGDGDITDEMYEEVKRFAKLVKLREEAEKKGEL